MSASRSPSGPAAVDAADSRSQRIGGIDGDAGLDLAHDLAAVLGLPRRPAEVGDDELAVVVQIRPGCDETPGEAARGGLSGVDLGAGPVADQEHLVAGRNLDLAPDRRRPWPGLGHGRHRQGRRGTGDPREQQAVETDETPHAPTSGCLVRARAFRRAGVVMDRRRSFPPGPRLPRARNDGWSAAPTARRFVISCWRAACQELKFAIAGAQPPPRIQTFWGPARSGAMSPAE